MAHEITIRSNGVAEAAFALEPAWHGLGAVLDHPMTSAEAITAAGLDWQVIQRPVGVQIPVTIDTPEGEVDTARWAPISDMVANCRSDNNHFLGTVSPKLYKVVQNTEAFAFLDGLIADHEMTYESAFSLSGGKKVCLLGRLPKVDTVVKGDDALRYVLLSLHHDGTGAIKFGPTSVRVVCANTYALALGEGNIRELSISHMGNVAAKLDKARHILNLANEQFDEHAETCRKLAEARMKRDDWEACLDIMCPIPDERDPEYSNLRAQRIAKTREAIREAFANERQTLKGVKGTAWAAYNAVSEYIDHLPRLGATRERKAEARFNVCLYGAGRDMKQRAFEAACRFAGLSLAS